MIAGPVCCAATVPVSTKIPVPIIAPSPTEVSVTRAEHPVQARGGFDLLVDGGDGLAGGELLENGQGAPDALIFCQVFPAPDRTRAHVGPQSGTAACPAAASPAVAEARMRSSDPTRCPRDV